MTTPTTPTDPRVTTTHDQENRTVSLFIDGMFMLSLAYEPGEAPPTKAETFAEWGE